MAHAAVLKAISLTHYSQTTFAEKINSNLDMVNSWINREIKVPIHYAFAIDTLTDGKVTWKEISPHLVHFEKLWDNRRFIPQFFPLKILNIPLSQIQYEVPNPPVDTSDIQNLAEQIKLFDLQHPIGLDTENQLMFGRKRLFAYQLLGKETIDCWSISLPALLAGQYLPETLCHCFRFSERLQISFALQKFIERYPGEGKNTSLRQENAEVKDQNDELIANGLGFDSGYTYAQAKMVYYRGSRALIHALDAKRLNLPAALCFLPLSHAEQKYILSQSDQVIMDFIQHANASQQSTAEEEEICV